MKIKDHSKYVTALRLHKAGQDILANLFLRAAYGVK